jgi:hypothetical protein
MKPKSAQGRNMPRLHLARAFQNFTSAQVGSALSALSAMLRPSACLQRQLHFQSPRDGEPDGLLRHLDPGSPNSLSLPPFFVEGCALQFDLDLNEVNQIKAQSGEREFDDDLEPLGYGVATR